MILLNGQVQPLEAIKTIRTRISLDGTWLLHLDRDESLQPDDLEQVPAVTVETPAPWQSQSDELRSYTGTVWYRREFEAPAGWEDGRVILGFGAVDYFAEVWVNDRRVGEHEGGYLPFELDITDAVLPGRNRLAVRVSDPDTIFPEIPHGKQSWYGPLSGIWQPVWLEVRPKVHLKRVKITPHAETGEVLIEVSLHGELSAEQQLSYRVFSPQGELSASLRSQDTQVVLDVPDVQRWDVDAPNLYKLEVSIEGGEADGLSDTFGFRTVGTKDGQILLNGRPLFLRGALDQDYYPDLICTPPSEEYLEEQFRKARAMGLNCLRIHIKVADPRYYAAADRVGILIWTELPNWQVLTEDAKRRARETLDGMVERDWNHPSIVIWTIVNESWGVDLTNPDHRAWLGEMYDHLKALDPYRLVVGNSACWGNFQVVTDIADFHNYYAMPDHYQKWKSWVESFAGRPAWTYARPYPGNRKWREFLKNPWRQMDIEHAREVRARGDEPLVVSEFGNWGLPDVDKLYAHYGGEPWWFETGHEWGEGVVYPHNIEGRFETFHLDRVFPTLKDLAQASQRMQFQAMKYEIEEMRRHPSLAGYVITEFTDVHWECNGLLDMLRNPKLYFEDFAVINSDDLIVPQWNRLSYRESEPVRVPLLLSHYSERDLNDCRLEWRLEIPGGPQGELKGLKPQRAGVSRLGTIRFEAPLVSQPTRARLDLRLVDRNGQTAGENFLELFFFPAGRPQAADKRIYAPALEKELDALGYCVVDQPGEADLAAAAVMTDELREYLLQGGKVLFLAESDNSLQTYLGTVDVVPRRSRSWQGDWASSLSWVRRDTVFRRLPVDRVVDFAFAGLTPEHVITGLSSHEFANQVHAGLTVGWLHRTVALVAERRHGKGHILISTFRLRRSLTRNPMAALMLDEMIYYLSAK
jgi:hypothetical protein